MLELLLLLRRDPERCWSEEELVRELRASHTVVAGSLRSAAASSLVERVDKATWRFQPAGLVLADLCEALEAAYRERPVWVLNMIAKPSSLQTLANAFKFRGPGQ